jgi:hypothetical protein
MAYLVYNVFSAWPDSHSNEQSHRSLGSGGGCMTAHKRFEHCNLLQAIWGLLYQPTDFPLCGDFIFIYRFLHITNILSLWVFEEFLRIRTSLRHRGCTCHGVKNVYAPTLTIRLCSRLELQRNNHALRPCTHTLLTYTLDDKGSTGVKQRRSVYERGYLEHLCMMKAMKPQIHGSIIYHVLLSSDRRRL